MTHNQLYYGTFVYESHKGKRKKQQVANKNKWYW